ALRRPPGGPVRLLAEIKRRSPSRGDIRPGATPEEIARIYHAAGAAAISVLTEPEFFGGHVAFLRRVKEVVPLPILSKDFHLEPYQLYEARAGGADAVLLIAAALPGDRLAELAGLAAELGMAALVEIWAEEEAERVAGLPLVGINHRDLHTLEMDLEVSRRLLEGGLRERLAPAAVVVGESGVAARAQVERLAALGLDALLVGTTLMAAADVGARVRELFGP
ncbi:MAG: indole-3-glycerol-phosphate synthase, partial [Nitrospirae bacterium]